MAVVSIASFNVRGIRSRQKRRTIFRHLHVRYPDYLVCIQETHSTAEIDQQWRNEWGSPIFFSHGSALSGGVAILIPRRFTGSIQGRLSDDEGRVIGIQFRMEEELFSLIGIYAPAVDVQEQKVSFFEKLKNNMVNFVNVNTILCRDFHVHLGPYDVEKGKYKASAANTYLCELAEQFCLKDVWRSQNPTKREYTWRRLVPLQQSRIDYVFASETVFCNFEVRSFIEAGIESDHSISAITVTSRNRRRGPGLYRFNNELLADSEFVELTKQEIWQAEKREGLYSGDIDDGVRMELLLSNIRVVSIRRSKHIAAEMREEEHRLLQEVTECERDLKSLDENQKAFYERSRQKLDEIKTKRAKRAIIASGARWVEDGEKSTAYFFNRAKQLSAQKSITELRENGLEIKDDKEILEYCAKHYEKVFTPEGVDSTLMNQFLSCEEIPKLTNEEKEQCEGPISREECTAALAKMNRNKAPGVSGFTPEFFLLFWDDIGSMVVSYVNHAFSHGFFISQRRGIVTLIPKKGVQYEMKNKRPICLLDVIYKIVAKVISNRIGLVADKLISSDQTGFMKGRFIGENLRLISDVIEYCQVDQDEGIIVACDYRAAFDSLEHEFIFAALKAYNFGDSLIAWVKLLYSEASLAIVNNGYSSRWFKCNRGTFQGSPLSGILFALAVEVLAINVRSNNQIRGIEVSGVEVKLSLYADDITLFMQNSQSGNEALRVMGEFSKASGLSLNLDKSHVMWLGIGKGKTESIGGIRAVEKIKILGIWFSASGRCLSDNVEPVIRKVCDTINIWSQRSITIKGRITVTRSLLASYLVYMSSCVEIPKKSVRSIQSKIMKFVWRGRPPKVSKDVLAQNIDQGGLRVVDVEAFCHSLKMAWISRMYNCKGAKWREMLQARVGKIKLEDLMKSCLCTSDIQRLRIPAFYKNVLTLYQNYKFVSMSEAQNVQREMLWYNRSIRIDNKTVFIYSLYKRGIKVIDDLIKDNGALMSIEELKLKYPGVKIDFLTYQALLRGIPGLWKKTLLETANQKLSVCGKSDVPSISIGDQAYKISDVRSKHFYEVELNSVTPKAVQRWENLGYHGVNWEEAFKIPYLCTKSTKLQSLQYRILHRYIPTRRYLYIRNVMNSPQCAYCRNEDTLEHFFFMCSNVKQIWEQIFRNLSITVQDPIRLVLFGLVNERNAINLIILLVKQYVVTSKLSYEQRVPNFEGVKALINYHISLEKHAAIVNDANESFMSKWHGLLNDNGTVQL